jgi:hypothetical protein
MAQGDDILSQADALMRRHRSFVARSDTADSPETASAGKDHGDADIPLLTEIVEIATGTDDGNARTALSKAIQSELNSWLDEGLPSRIDALTEQIGKQLLADLKGEALNTLLPRLLAALEAPQEKE